MKARLLPLLLEFIALTVPATWLWLVWGRDAYYRFFVSSARPLLIALGVTGVRRDVLHEYFINYLPFVVLMLITPQLSWKRRTFGTLGGCVVIYLGHVLLAWAAFVAFIREGPSPASTANFFPAMLLTTALPFVLWAVLANRFVSELLSGLFVPSKGDAEADEEVE